MFARVKSPVVFGALLLLVVLTSWPLMQPTLFIVHDFVQGARIVELANGLQQGQLPVIWSQHLGYGYGMPLFQFYAPLPYYFTAVFYLLGTPLASSVKLLFWVVNIGIVTLSYQLGKRLFTPTLGVLLAALISLAPYRALNLYIRGAVSESWGMMAGVGMFLGATMIIKNQRAGWWVFLVSSVGLMLSHNLSIILFVPFVAVFSLLLMTTEKKSSLKWLLQTAGTFVAAGILAVGLSAFYLLPMFLEKDFTQVESLIVGVGNYFDYHIHYLYIKQFLVPFWGYGGSGYGPNDTISFYLGAGMLLALPLAGAAVSVRIQQVLGKNIRNWKLAAVQPLLKELYWPVSLLVLGLLSLWLATAKAGFVWDSIEMLRFIQFPWRFIGVAVVLLSLGCVASLAQLRSQFVQKALSVLLFAVLLLNGQYFRPEEYLPSNDQYYYSDPGRIAAEMSKTLPDYLPTGFNSAVPVATTAIASASAGVEGHYTVQQNKATQLILATEFSESQLVSFARASYPGWQVSSNDQPLETTSSADGLVTAQVPAGRQVVVVELLDTPVRAQAKLISVVAVLITGAIVVWQQKKKYEYR